MKKRVITAKEAADILGRGGTRRPVRRGHVAALGLKATSGNWKPEASIILLDGKGQPRDGVHRLTMQVEQELDLEHYVIEADVADAVMDAQGLVAKRNAADTLALHGWGQNGDPAYLTAKASAARYIKMFEVGNTRPVSLDNEATLAVAENYRKELDNLAPYCQGGPFKFQSAALGAAVIIARDATIDDATEFMDAIRTGAELKQFDPRLKVARKLRAIAGEPSDGANETNYGKSSRSFYVLLHAWKRFKRNQEARSLRDDPVFDL